MEATTHKQPNYAAVFWSLFFLTIGELIVANLHMSKLAIILGLLTLAIIKAVLVALFYMHLKFEKLLIYIIIFLPLLLAANLVVITLLDKGHLRVTN